MKDDQHRPHQTTEDNHMKDEQHRPHQTTEANHMKDEQHRPHPLFGGVGVAHLSYG
jgi:hypothetical protein